MTTIHAREAQVLDAAARGLTVQQTGRELFLSVDTIKTYRRRVLRRTGARNMAQAVAMWQREGQGVERRTAAPQDSPGVPRTGRLRAQQFSAE